MKVFFDTEFTGLHKDTSLISIGLISEDRRCFYAELTDYDEKQCDDWIRENVIKHLNMSKNEEDRNYISNYHVGTKDDIGIALSNWFKQFNEVELVSDVCHYDMVLLIDIFGGAFDLPEFISPVCIDINQIIASKLNITDKEAFNLSREKLQRRNKYYGKEYPLKIWKNKNINRRSYN